jgi:hypothetical protein
VQEAAEGGSILCVAVPADVKALLPFQSLSAPIAVPPSFSRRTVGKSVVACFRGPRRGPSLCPLDRTVGVNLESYNQADERDAGKALAKLKRTREEEQQ